MKKKDIVIPDRVFHRIWNVSLLSESYSDFYSSITNPTSKNYIDLYKYGFDLDLIYDTLTLVFETSNLTITNLLDKYNIKKAALSHRFCIPIRTIENWCDGSGKCSPYIILMILESYKIKYLPNRVYTESLYQNKPLNPSSTRSAKSQDKKEIEKTDSSTDEFDFDRIDKMLDEIHPEHFSIKEFEQTHLVNNDSFLAETDYLRKHMK